MNCRPVLCFEMISDHHVIHQRLLPDRQEKVQIAILCHLLQSVAIIGLSQPACAIGNFISYDSESIG